MATPEADQATALFGNFAIGVVGYAGVALIVFIIAGADRRDHPFDRRLLSVRHRPSAARRRLMRLSSRNETIVIICARGRRPR